MFHPFWLVVHQTTEHPDSMNMHHHEMSPTASPHTILWLVRLWSCLFFSLLSPLKLVQEHSLELLSSWYQFFLNKFLACLNTVFHGGLFPDSQTWTVNTEMILSTCSFPQVSTPAVLEQCWDYSGNVFPPFSKFHHSRLSLVHLYTASHLHYFSIIECC